MKPRSMEEKISYLLFLMGFAGLACTAALCIFVFHKAFREQAWTALSGKPTLWLSAVRRWTPPAAGNLCGRLAAHHSHRLGRQCAF